MTTQDEVAFASLLASRLCHDLVNPAGALRTGLDVLETESDPEMREHADRLVKDSTERLLAVIEYARIAYGASGGSEGELGTEELKVLAVRLYAHLKPELTWKLTRPALKKWEARSLLNLLLCAERIAPRAGSRITVEDDGASFRLVAEGRKAKLPDDMEAIFAGADIETEPKAMPAKLAQRLTAAAGKSFKISVQEDLVTLSVA